MSCIQNKVSSLSSYPIPTGAAAFEIAKQAKTYIVYQNDKGQMVYRYWDGRISIVTKRGR